MALFVLDDKKKVLLLYFRERQVRSFRERGTCVLGAMVFFRCNVKFYDFVIKGHSNQNSTQILGILKVLQQTITDDYPLELEIVLHSDSAPAYSASENIRFIYQLNSRRPYLTLITRWINNGAQKGKTKLECHFS